MDDLVELDYRAVGELEVSLFWERATNALRVQVVDGAADEAFSFGVEAADALDAFRHPFAYGARTGGASEGRRSVAGPSC